MPLGVGHWTFTAKIKNKMPRQRDRHFKGTEAIARSTTEGMYDEVDFLFRRDFIDSATQQRLDEVIVHEWLHVSQRDMDSALWETFEELQGKRVKNLLASWLVHEQEGNIDRLSRLIVSLHQKAATLRPT